MFDVSWGELAVLGAVGIAVTGKRDLPTACRFVGHQLGRVVGLLQGARARADRFAHHNELRALQNELRSGLRELDQVKTELAVAASSRGVMGRGLGATTLSANKVGAGVAATATAATNMTPPTLGMGTARLGNSVAKFEFPSTSTSGKYTNHQSSLSVNDNTQVPSMAQPLHGKHRENQANSPPQPNLSDFDFTVVDTETEAESKPTLDRADNGEPLHSSSPPSSPPPHHSLPSGATQSERAAMEDEWNKQGIGFRARAERGSWKQDDAAAVGLAGGGGGSSLFGNFGVGGGDENSSGAVAAAVADTTRATGSELLEDLERQCLIFDQYDRVVGEQEAEMQRRVDRIREERLAGREGSGDDDGK
mmetsp:Transcript_5705/g.16322  ORF Transcript_5705/g.16322 Transcript_5705/m.16322 type:complete len:364 (+) Transcript_5705:276-1367(+)